MRELLFTRYLKGCYCGVYVNALIICKNIKQYENAPDSIKSPAAFSTKVYKRNTLR